MSEGAHRRTEAEVRKSWWPGWIWAVPIAAIAVAGWLGVRALAEGGETVTVAFDASYGAKEGDTKVTLRGVKVGEVAQVALGEGARGVEMKLKLDRAVKKYLRTGTRFWLEGAKVSVTDLASLKALVSGPEIAMEPGPGEPTRRFVGLDQPPAISRVAQGTAFVLTADRLATLQQGSSIYYAGKAVGKITDIRLVGPHSFQIGAFVRAPYDRYVTTASRFWNASAVEVSGSGRGLRAELVSAAALVAGGVAFDTPSEAADAATARPGQRFPLFADHDHAKDAPLGPEAPYLVRFDGAVGDLKPGAEVELRGFRVGEVTSVKLGYDIRTGRLDTPVRIELEPLRLDIQGAPPPPHADWRPLVDTMLRRLIARGLRATLVKDPPVIGGSEVQLDFVPGARRAALVRDGGVMVIPSTSSGDIAAIERKADQVMTKIDAIPIDRIGENVRRITARIRELVDSPRLNDIVEHVDSTSVQVDRTVHEVAPQVGPLVAKLRQTADEADTTVAAANRIIGGDPESQDSDLPSALHQLTDAARSIRALADYLDRHPEALIKGKAKPKESP